MYGLSGGVDKEAQASLIKSTPSDGIIPSMAHPRSPEDLSGIRELILKPQEKVIVYKPEDLNMELINKRCTEPSDLIYLGGRDNKPFFINCVAKKFLWTNQESICQNLEKAVGSLQTAIDEFNARTEQPETGDPKSEKQVRIYWTLKNLKDAQTEHCPTDP